MLSPKHFTEPDEAIRILNFSWTKYSDVPSNALGRSLDHYTSLLCPGGMPEADHGDISPCSQGAWAMHV